MTPGGRPAGAIAMREYLQPVTEAKQPVDLAALLAPSLAAMGYELVRARVIASGKPVLQIMAERTDGSGITLDDCARVSRQVSAVLDVEDPIGGPYTLEVGSPGIDRPLVNPRDFERFAGCEARIETEAAIDGRRKFTGRLAGLVGNGVRITVAEGAEPRTYDVPIGGIRSAKLVLTDELIKRSKQPGPQA